MAAQIHVVKIIRLRFSLIIRIYYSTILAPVSIYKPAEDRFGMLVNQGTVSLTGIENRAEAIIIVMMFS
jgi:hypothetical protein